MLKPYGNGHTHKGKTGTHNTRQPNTNRPCTFTLNNSDHTGNQHGGINQHHHIFGRQPQHPANHQRHRNNGTQRRQQMLGSKQNRGCHWRPVFNFVKEFHCRLLE